MQARDTRLAALRERVFDVLVVGGGITGSGIARDAALRGLSVALVEKDDFASGTSSRSSRLVHGGVRYLEHGHLHLVFESSAERRRLLRLAPHLVHPLRFTWPVYAGARIPRWKLGAGLLLYDLLALFRNVGRHQRLSAREVLAAEPLLRADGLRGGATYFDAATNDARLTLANAIAASEAGAVVLNHARVVSFVRDSGHIRGATVRDEFSGEAVAVRASAVVNATGPWSDGVRGLDEPNAASAVRGSKGVHIAVDSERIDNRGAVTLLSPRDGRVFFVLPSDHTTIIGTTDTFTPLTPDEVRATTADVDYLLASANEFFPYAKLERTDVIRAWAGIRPLLPTRGDVPGSASREHAIATSVHGLVSITGGKLTTYRVMAAEVVDNVADVLRRKTSGRASATTPLPGGDFRTFEHLAGEIARTTGDVALAAHLANAYGSRWRGVWQEISAGDGREALVDQLPYTVGELRYCVRHEMACTLGDLLIRRTHLAFEVGDAELAAAASRAASAVGPLLSWTADERHRATIELRAEVERMFGITSIE